MWTIDSAEAVARMCSVKKVVLKISQSSQENTSARVSFLIKLQVETCNFIKEKTLAQAFSYEFSEMFKIAFLTVFLLCDRRLILNQIGELTNLNIVLCPYLC